MIMTMMMTVMMTTPLSSSSSLAWRAPPPQRQVPWRCAACLAVAPFGLFLHPLADRSGVDTAHARVARENYVKEISKIKSGGDCMRVDLARAALEVSAEDDALVSHSPVALPVDSYIERLDSMSIEFAKHHMPSTHSTPDAVLACLDDYFYVYKGFQRLPIKQQGDARGSYLNMVLTRRVGTPIMLALVYSEIVRKLRERGLIDFSLVMELSDSSSCFLQPRVVMDEAFSGPKVSVEGPSRVLTPQVILSEMMRSLKSIYWPWKLVNGRLGGSEFLRAVEAANIGISSRTHNSLFPAASNVGADLAFARAARHRLQRGIWTSTSFGDMRRALAASERLVLLGLDAKESRDYGVLLYHCGFYEAAFKYLNAFYSYQSDLTNDSSDRMEGRERLALESLLMRLKLIMEEETDWDINAESFLPESLPDPW